VATALAQHAFAGPTNKFWPLLYSSGITSLRHTFEIDKSLPKLYNVGITNLIPRPTRCASELSKSEMLASVDVVEEKVRMYKPKAVCVVGKGIWETFYERKHAGKKVGKDFKFGWQAERIGIGNDWSGAQCFVTPSTSGRVATYSREFQEVLWKELGCWVRLQRRDIEQEGVKLESEDDMAVSEFSHRTNIKKEVLDT
jgi:thymine-DNA glycosylase